MISNNSDYFTAEAQSYVSYVFVLLEPASVLDSRWCNLRSLTSIFRAQFSLQSSEGSIENFQHPEQAIAQKFELRRFKAQIFFFTATAADSVKWSVLHIRVTSFELSDV